MKTKSFLLVMLLLWLTFDSKAGTDHGTDTIVINDAFKRFLVVPIVLRSPETGWGFGTAGAYFFKAKRKDETLRTSDVNFAALYTLKKQLLIALGSSVFFPDEKYIFRFNGSYSYYPDKTWGIGNNTPNDIVEYYSLKQFFLNPQFLRKLFYNFYIGGSYEFQRITDFNYAKEGLFELNNIDGRNGGNTSGLGVLITWDTRNNSFSPDKGSFAELNFTAFHKQLGSDYNFITLTADARKFFPLHKNRVLALQALFKVNNGSVPFRNLSFIGGSEMMRGYYKGRFADDDMMAYQAELRQFLFWRLGVTAFASMGEVSARIDDFSLNELHFAFGGGLRILLKKDEKLNLRIDYGRGKKSDGVYVILREAF